MFKGSDKRSPDPFRAELDAQWDFYMQHHRPSAEFDEWLPVALGGSRDEIVHFGAQLLSDLVIHEWNGDRAQAKHALYLDEARKYDADPKAWETAFWSPIREKLRPDHREHFDQTTF